MRFAKTIGLVTLLLTGLTPVAGATPPDIYGFGIRASALGGAVTADVEGPSANYYNPAGLVRDDSLRIGLWYFSSSPFLDINGERSEVERHGAANLGLVAPAEFDGMRLAFGLGIHLPDQRIARTRSSIVDRPRWELYDTRSHRIFLTTNLAFSPVDWISFGAGLNFQSSSVLTLDLRGDAHPFQPEDLSRLEHQFKGDLTSVPYIQAGVQIRPHERIDVGLTYRQQYRLGNQIIALADANIIGLGDPIPLRFALDTAATSLFGPHQLSLAVSGRPIDSLRISAELTWYRYSSHPSLISDQVIVIEADVPAGIPVELPDEIFALPPIDMGMSDIFVPRVGVEWQAVDNASLGMTLRAGYFFHASPFPVQTGVTNFVDNTKHSVSLGWGIALRDLDPTLPGELRFDIFARYDHLVTREHVKDSLVDPVGDYVSGGRIFAIGAGAEVVFE